MSHHIIKHKGSYLKKGFKIKVSPGYLASRLDSSKFYDVAFVSFVGSTIVIATVPNADSNSFGQGWILKNREMGWDTNECREALDAYQKNYDAPHGFWYVAIPGVREIKGYFSEHNDAQTMS